MPKLYIIPPEVIERRYYRGVKNLFNLYLPTVDNWFIIDNMDTAADIIAGGSREGDKEIKNPDLWDAMFKLSKSYGE